MATKKTTTKKKVATKKGSDFDPKYFDAKKRKEVDAQLDKIMKTQCGWVIIATFEGPNKKDECLHEGGLKSVSVNMRRGDRIATLATMIEGLDPISKLLLLAQISGGLKK